MSDCAWDDMVTVGRVARTHGNRGAVVVNPETDFPDARFGAGCIVYLRRGADPEALRIRSVRFQHGRPIIQLMTVDTMTEAEALSGQELRVPASDLVPLPAGAFYRHDLVGCRVVTARGEPVGVVTAVEGEVGVSRLVVDTPCGEVLVPVAQGICVRIDPQAREIAIDPPEGLLDLNR